MATGMYTSSSSGSMTSLPLKTVTYEWLESEIKDGRTHFTNIVLASGVSSGVPLIGVTFTECSFRGSQIGPIAEQVTFENCDLTRAYFSGDSGERVFICGDQSCLYGAEGYYRSAFKFKRSALQLGSARSTGMEPDYAMLTYEIEARTLTTPAREDIEPRVWFRFHTSNSTWREKASFISGVLTDDKDEYAEFVMSAVVSALETQVLLDMDKGWHERNFMMRPAITSHYSGSVSHATVGATGVSVMFKPMGASSR